MKILFVTTANLSTNPRLYKEIKLAEELGHSVSYIAFHQGGWSDEKDKVLNKEITANRHYLSALRNPFIPWLVSTVLHRLYRLISHSLKDNLWIVSIAHNKRSWHLLKFLSRNHNKYDLVIGHNLGTLYPAWRYAQTKGIPFAFDVEDYHPGEASAISTKGEVERREKLMSELIPQALYYTYASPKIGDFTGNLVSSSLFSTKCLINNSFSNSEFVPPVSSGNNKLKLVWFSQNINYGRGLEWMLPVLDQFSNDLELFLIGSLNKNFNQEYIKARNYISIVPPLTQQSLNKSLSQYDIGLALELNEADLNRSICLTNKIWAYLQAGLYILATDTPAQQLFISEHTSHGILTSQDPTSFQKALMEILSRKDQIREEAEFRFVKAREFSWENESKKLTKIWEEVRDVTKVHTFNSF